MRLLPPIRYEDVAFKPFKFETYEQLRVELEPTFLQHRLDLRPYINRNGYQMPKHASVASCFHLFRKLGLRHLPIVASNGDLCGIVTRKDLILCEEDHVHFPDPDGANPDDDDSCSTEGDSFRADSVSGISDLAEDREMAAAGSVAAHDPPGEVVLYAGLGLFRRRRNVYPRATGASACGNAARLYTAAWLRLTSCAAQLAELSVLPCPKAGSLPR
eukprot:UN0193